MKLHKLSKAIWLLIVVGSAACSGSSPTEPTPDSSATVASVEVSGPANFEALGQNGQLVAVAKTADGVTIPDQSFSWSSSNTSVATVGSTGSVTSVGNGTTTIRAQTGGIAGEVSVSVDQVPALVSLDSDDVTFQALGDSARLAAIAEDANGNPIPSPDITWASTATGVVSVDAAGLTVALAPGTALIVASAGSVADTATLRVEQAINTLEISPPVDTLNAIDDTAQMGAVLYDANGNSVSGVAPNWTSLAPAIVDIDGNGLATALADGEALIVASANGKVDTAAVKVIRDPATIQLTTEKDTLSSVADTTRIQAIVLDRNGYEIQNLVPGWRSEDESSVTITADGLATAVANGTSSIISTLGAVADTVSIVVEQVAETLQISIPSDTMTALGDTIRLSAEASDANAYQVEGLTIDWVSVDPAATVDGSGLVSAIDNGSARIVAAAQGLQDTAAVVIKQVTVSLAVSPSSDTLTALGDTLRLVAQAWDRNGNAIADPEVGWSSDNAPVASVDSTGLVTAVTEGLAAITAADAGIEQQALVRVRLPGTIVFSSDHDGDWDLYSIKSDGTGLTQITNSASEQEQWPVLSADGQKIAYESNGEVWVMDIDGANNQRLTWIGIDTYRPTWSPDGDAVVVWHRRYGGGNYDWYILGLDSSWQQLPHGNGRMNWSHGDSLLTYGGGNGGRAIMLLDFAGDLNTPIFTMHATGDARFSPSGDRIAFHGRPSDADPWNIYIIDKDGQNLEHLSGSSQYRSPTWSPDGTEIAFLRGRDLWVMHADGTNERQLTDFDTGSMMRPSWYN